MLSMQGTFFPVLSPIVSQNYRDRNILSSKKLPSAGKNGYKYINVYQAEENLIFLYTNGKENARSYNIEKNELTQITKTKYPYDLNEQFSFVIDYFQCVRFF